MNPLLAILFALQLILDIVIIALLFLRCRATSQGTDNEEQKKEIEREIELYQSVIEEAKGAVVNAKIAIENLIRLKKETQQVGDKSRRKVEEAAARAEEKVITRIEQMETIYSQLMQHEEVERFKALLIQNMIEQGKNSQEIAQELGLPFGEVELIARMSRRSSNV